MRHHPLRPVTAVLCALLLTASGWAAARAPYRIVLLPFDASASVEAFALAFPAALQRGLNELDGVHVPAVGDAGVVLQRAVAAGEDDALAHLSRVFDADALVLGRLRGSDALTLDLVVVRGGEERTRNLAGRAGDLPSLWQAAAEAVLEDAGRAAGIGDRAALRRVLVDAPSLPSLGPLGVATSRLPGARLDQLESAAALDPGSAWVRSELARALALAGQAERARSEAEAAVELMDTVETRTMLGVVLLAVQDAGAQAVFEAALEGNRAHAVALLGLAEAGVEAAERSELLERAVTASPRLAEAHLVLAASQTSPSRTVQVLRRASAFLPDSPAVQAALIDAVVDAGDARGALDLLRASLADPVGRRSAVYALAGRLPDAIGEDALALVREGIERFPDSPELRRVEIDLLRRTGDAFAAEAALRAWVESGRAGVSDTVALAESLAMQGEVDEAQRLLATVAEADPEADLRSARLDLAAGRPRAALLTLEPRIAAGDADPLRRTIYAIALGRVGRLAEAMEMLGEIVAGADGISSTPAGVEAVELAGRALAVLREQDRIAGDGVALEGEAATAFQRGLFALETGDPALARDAFARARELQDAGIVAFFEGYARQLSGDPRGAIAAYQAARAELGDHDVLLNNLGHAQLQVGRLDLALGTLREALASNPSNARAHLNLGLAYYGLARFGDAVASFDAALELDPTLAESAGPTIEDARRRSGN